MLKIAKKNKKKKASEGKRRKMDAAIWSAQLGITHPEDGRPLTLAEAAQIRLYNREQKQFRNFRTGERLSLAESEKFCSPFVQRRLIQLGVLTLPPMALEQALNSGLLHPISGMFFHGKYLQFPLEEALGRGFIRLPPTQPLLALTLTDCIVQRFINGDSGKFEGNHKNERFTLFDALSVHKPPLINGKVRECINTATGRRLTVEEAIAEGVLNLNTGTFTDMAQQNEMSLNDAHLLGLIQKPRTLTELLEDEAFDKQLGVFMERGGLITLLEAISSGLLDANVWHIKTGQSDEVIAIGDALARGVLKPEGKIAVELVKEGGSHGGHLLELHEAHERGYLTHRTRHTIFDVKIVKNTEQGKLMSFNEAIENGTIQLQNEQFLYRTGHQTMPFSDALAQKLINPNFAAIFVGRLGIIEEGKEISLLDAVARGIVDAPNGVFIHPKNKSKITVREAYDLGQFLSLFDAIRIAALCDINSLMINSDGE